MPRKKLITACMALTLFNGVQAHDEHELTSIEVRAQSENLEGLAQSSSEGRISALRLDNVPLLRPGEALEMVPGLIVTQHAGDGKANQYFLRGFNLDHGTDFSTRIGGMPVNMPSHAHGQGYTDLNFLIPELIDRISYRKGPYFAEEGDFSSAGSAQIDYMRQMAGNLAQATLGAHGYTRTLLAGSPHLGNGRLLYGLEAFHNDGPWQQPENYRKFNGLLRYSAGSRENGFTLNAMAYRGAWRSSDQIAQRAIEQNLVDRYGSLDSSSGGSSRRYSLSADWAKTTSDSQSKASAWWLRSELDLWSNFTYCTQGCPDGDQFKQAEQRQAGGFALSHAIQEMWGAYEVENTLGLQGRIDRISPLGLYATRNREILSTVREDKVTQKSLAFWLQNEIRWTSWLRTIGGLRADQYAFAVDSNLAANTGKNRDHMLTPKLSLIFSPKKGQEWYLNYGHGFHSNDARGTTIRLDPATGTPVTRVPGLVRTRGEEIGWRAEFIPGWQSTVAVWQLDSASELLFVGDAGNTEASRPARRKGIEWTHLYTPADWLAIDADFSWSRARYRDPAPEGQHIPGALSRTANLGLSIDQMGRWFGALRLRYFGPRPLTEDNAVRAAGSTLTNLRVGYKMDANTRISFDIYNLFNRKLNDIEYWYESRLSGEGGNQFDRHVHPVEPRTLRATLSLRF